MEIPETSWEAFEACNTCGTKKHEPCWNLRLSTTKHLVRNQMPHRGRKMISTGRAND